MPTEKGFQPKQIDPAHKLTIAGKVVVIQAGKYTDLDVVALQGLATFMESASPAGLGDAMIAGWESLQAILGDTAPGSWFNPKNRRLGLHGVELLEIVKAATEILQTDPRYLALQDKVVGWEQEAQDDETKSLGPLPVTEQQELQENQAKLLEALAIVNMQMAGQKTP